ncbi:HAD family hydrolase [Aliarcobacter butzleri]|uniref:phosphoglycolate phosphatase n=1 Tax=Aliarcobacter butzleri TaxID=28197 RepID=A0AAW7Q990_9BACT|nr:HAD family hydrolase [Aliarcobacter butzleri]MCG3711045.1 HAD family hydrolase [Aliarcobacter butzleri]MDH1975869.1 HAD family hydrolase [Aliarcobacter butzleri]MDN5097386.1 HAD family hydrolase [Aliarcobacter butzleri]MDN5107624.1 HAD family hydrolase [Aliarcobacter butzleri]MDN5122948.1 HAD family hydrolase [Aliarcobacter butzleri]
MNKIILFDLDGTLIDSTDAIVSTFRFAFKEQGFDFRGSDKNIKDLIGYPLDIMFERLGVSKQKVWDYVDSYKNRYRVISVEQTTLLENAFDAVQLASKIARVSVVTTKTRMYTIPILDNFNITQYFEIITGRENVENPKPHPEPILKTLAQMNYDKNKDEVYMIGDTKLDLICANEAKVNAIGVLCGYSDEEELLKYTNIVKKDALEAIKYISTL